jgi:hypothetical protein
MAMLWLIYEGILQNCAPTEHLHHTKIPSNATVNHVVKGRTFSIYQLAAGCGHNQSRLSFNRYFKVYSRLCETSKRYGCPVFQPCISYCISFLTRVAGLCFIFDLLSMSQNSFMA